MLIFIRGAQCIEEEGAPAAIRTRNRRIRSPVLYPLSYGGRIQLYCKD